MGKHGNKDSNTQPEGKDTGYDPKHAGGWDGYEWAKTTADTVELPKVKKAKEKW